MKVVITGGSGFVGRHLSHYLLTAGHTVTALGTRPTHDRISHERYHYIPADTSQPGQWQDRVARADWIINLAGRTIFKRWTRKYKRQIYDSRILTTRNIVAALPDPTPAVLISTSAVGYYGNGGEAELTEDSPSGKDFLADLVKDWEAEAHRATAKGARVAVARFGIVLGADGGALAKMVPAFRFFVGGPLGNGRQWFPWIHIEDLVRALVYMATHNDLTGQFNMTAPHPVRNGDMALALGRVLGRPALLAVPRFMLKVTMGELAGVLLSSQRALPTHLLKAGFEFSYSKIDDALVDLVR